MLNSLTKKVRQANSPLNESFRLVLVWTDFLTLAVMIGLFFTVEGGVYRLVNQGFAALLVLTYVMNFHRLRLRFAPEFYLAIMFVVWSWGTGMLVGDDKTWVTRYGFMVTRFVIMCSAVSGFAMARNSSKIGFAIIVIAAGYLIYFVMRTPEILTELMYGIAKYKEVGINPNTVGLAMLWATISLSVLWGETSRFIWRTGFVGLAIAFSYILISTGSRKSFLGLLFFIAVYLLFCHAKKVFRSLSSFIMVLVLLVSVYIVVVKIIPGTYMAARLEKTEKDGGLDETRKGMYREGWKMFLDHPIAGVGLGNFLGKSTSEGYSHSDYIEVLSTTGVVGFTLYFPIYLVLWLRIARVKKRTNDPKEKYQMGVYQALIVTTLFIGGGTPTFLNLDNWFRLALMIGHTLAIEHNLRRIRLPGVGRESLLLKGALA